MWDISNQNINKPPANSSAGQQNLLTNTSALPAQLGIDPAVQATSTLSQLLSSNTSNCANCTNVETAAAVNNSWVTTPSVDPQQLSDKEQQLNKWPIHADPMLSETSVGVIQQQQHAEKEWPQFSGSQQQQQDKWPQTTVVPAVAADATTAPPNWTEFTPSEPAWGSVVGGGGAAAGTAAAGASLESNTNQDAATGTNVTVTNSWVQQQPPPPPATTAAPTETSWETAAAAGGQGQKWIVVTEPSAVSDVATASAAAGSLALQSGSAAKSTSQSWGATGQALGVVEHPNWAAAAVDKKDDWAGQASQFCPSKPPVVPEMPSAPNTKDALSTEGPMELE